MLTARKAARGRWLLRVLAAPTHEFDYRWLICVIWSLEVYHNSYGYGASLVDALANGLVVVAVCTYFVHLELRDGYLSRALQCSLGYLAAVPFTVAVTYGLWQPYSNFVRALVHQLLFSCERCAVKNKRGVTLEEVGNSAVLMFSALYVFVSVMKVIGHWEVMTKRLPCHRVRFKEPLYEVSYL